MKKNKNILFLLTLVIVFIIVRLLFDFNGLYGQDSFEYLRFTKELYSFWNGGPKPHDFFWPVGYPLLASFFNFITRDAALALQIVSYLSFVGILIYTRRSLLSLFPGNKNIHSYTLLFVFLSPFFLRAAFLCMSDMLAAFFVTACFSHYLFYHQSKKWIHFSACIFFAITAILVRYGTVVIIIAPALAASFSFMKQFSFKAAIITLLLALMAIAPHVFFTTGPTLNFTQHNWVTTWSVTNFFQNTFNTGDGGYQKCILINILFCLAMLFHPGYFIFGAAFIPGSLKNIFKGYKFILVFSVLAYLLFLAGIPHQNKRYFLVALPFVVILLFEGYDKLMFKYKWFKHSAWLVPAISLTLIVYSFNLVGKRMSFEKKIYTYLELNAKNKNIYTFDVEVALRGYELPANVIGLWHRPYTDYKTGDLVLFNEALFGKQWKGHTLMKNWDHLNSNYKLKPLHSFGDGWELYEIS